MAYHLLLSPRMNREPRLAWVNDVMYKLEDDIRSASQIDARVMMTGESGVGKSFAANLIHQLSPRRRAPFIVVNAADAVEGLLRTARGGTILFQEIDNISLAGQAEILRLLDCAAARENNVRMMTATNVHLFDRVNSGEFREDLFYRLNVIHLLIPPLRERPEDIPLMF